MGVSDSGTERNKHKEAKQKRSDRRLTRIGAVLGLFRLVVWRVKNGRLCYLYVCLIAAKKSKALLRHLAAFVVVQVPSWLDLQGC